ncbi:PPK2 family polyphosphate kinase [Sorangium sp. So ce590]|uniref:PPK2 family polyphosphate kinase n=1 Tax=unclassified Sorangium TaxID=2621164 RepID=UPI003F5D997E
MPITRLTKADSKVRLDDISTDPPRDATKQEAAERLKELGKELLELQELMWGARTHSVLIVLQGRDAAGKDGAIKNVVGALNPRGVSVSSFGVPTKEEREHDFLWRIHRQAPRAGEFAIFNRSHYEDVLVVRVHDLAPKSLWGERYDHINDFEELLAEHGTLVLKFFLHISKKEQEKRLLEREEDPSTAWKLNVNDWKEREHWDEYTEAYEEVFRRCTSRHAPWCIVPADAKWYRNLVVAEAVAEAMREYRDDWLKTLERNGRAGREELEEYRRSRGVRHKG